MEFRFLLLSDLRVIFNLIKSFVFSQINHFIKTDIYFIIGTVFSSINKQLVVFGLYYDAIDFSDF